MTTKTPSRLTPGQAAASVYAKLMNPVCCMPGHLDWDAIAAAAIEASPELKRLRERLAAAQAQAASGSELLEKSRDENERLRARVTELEEYGSELRGWQAARDNLIGACNQLIDENERLRETKHICGLSGWNPMRDEPCPGCKERFK
jgi:hypothetical protein